MSAEEERRPLVYEDAEMLDQERRARRGRVCRVGGAVLVVGCLALAVGLAVALPLSRNRAPAPGTSDGRAVPQLLQLIALPAPTPTSKKTPPLPKESSSFPWTTPTPSSARLRSHGGAPVPGPTLVGGMHGWGPRDNEDWITRWTPDHTDDDTTTRRHTFPTHSTRPPPPACPPVPPAARRDHIDPAQFSGPDGLVEVAYVQTYDSPGFVFGLACSTVQLNMTGTRTAVVSTSWDQGTIRHHSHHTETIALRATDTLNDWTFSVTGSDNDHEGLTGTLSLLALWEDKRYDAEYLLTYTCYPEAQRGFGTGYSMSVWTRGGEKLPLFINWPLVENMLRAAAFWGLNPDELHPNYPPFRLCKGDD